LYAQAQWLNQPTPGAPRTPDGKVNMTGPAPHANGKPDPKSFTKPVAINFVEQVVVSLLLLHCCRSGGIPIPFTLLTA
jgi:hypothetical protein